MINGTLRFSALQVLEVSAEFKQGGVTLTGKAAFVDTTTGASHAWTRGEGAIWSRDTVAKLEELRLAMEQDLARLHMSDHNVVEGNSRPEPRIGGITEHLESRSFEADQA